MKHVYLVYEECHGLVMVCGSEASADRKVLSLALEIGIDVENTKLDYDSPSAWGWSECHWIKEVVVYD